MSDSSLRDERARAEIVVRIGNLTPESECLWGGMSPARVLTHLADAMRLAFLEGEVRTSNADAPFASRRREWIHERPWPKGKAKSPPEGFQTSPTDWETDRELLLDLVERFANSPAQLLAGSHPMFGEMKEEDWDVLMHKHVDHHLRQFGV
jgi:hypothetical protein